MFTKRLAAMLIAALMLIPTLASCSDGGSAADPSQTTAEETTTAETTTAELQPDIPASDFEGAEFLFLTAGDADTNGVDWKTYDIWAEAENGDSVNDAVYTRNMYVNETYNVNIAEKQSEATTLAEAQKVILAGEDVYDAIVSNLVSCATLAETDLTYNMYDIPYIDLTQPWWDTNLAENLSVAGKMNYATGDIMVLDNDAVWVLMFNKQMVDDMNLDSPYDLVRNDEWYFDDFIEMMADVSADVNGDGKYEWADDRFGLVTTHMLGDTIMYNCGLQLTAKNSDDIPEYKFNLERASSIAEDTGIIMTSNNTVIADSTKILPADIRACFEDGRALFYGEVLQCVTRMRSSDTDFGVLPWPKYDEIQEEFASVAIPSAAKAVTVPKTQLDLDMTGVVLEAMAAKSMYTLTPAYYDVAITSKYMRDEESAEMLDIILANMSLDLAYVYNWGTLITNYRNSIKANDGAFVSTVESGLSAFETAMAKTIAAYTD